MEAEETFRNTFHIIKNGEMDKLIYPEWILKIIKNFVL
jgi:hypothetical protein